MGRIHDLQVAHQLWLNHNFPGQRAHQPLLGMIEEVGELSHAHLKNEQDIRGMDSVAATAAKIDALGDLFIYMMSYASANYIDLETAIEETWMQVKKRDWVIFPQNGLTA